MTIDPNIDIEAPPYEVVAEDTKERVVHIGLREAADVLDDGMFWDNEGPGFSCREAEALGALLWHAGIDIDRVVDLIVSGHGQPDRSEDFGDDHWHEPRDRYPDYPGDDEPRLTGHPPNPETEDTDGLPTD